MILILAYFHGQDFTIISSDTELFLIMYSHLEQDVPFDDEAMVARGNFHACVGFGPPENLGDDRRFPLYLLTAAARRVLFLHVDLKHPPEGAFPRLYF